MSIRRSAHAVYDTKYHLVWAPKYRKWIKREEIRDKAEEIFREVAESFGFEIQEMRVAPDHVHIFLSFPPRYSIAKVVGILKSISASEIFEKFPEVKRELWGGEAVTHIEGKRKRVFISAEEILNLAKASGDSGMWPRNGSSLRRSKRFFISKTRSEGITGAVIEACQSTRVDDLDLISSVEGISDTYRLHFLS